MAFPPTTRLFRSIMIHFNTEILFPIYSQKALLKELYQTISHLLNSTLNVKVLVSSSYNSHRQYHSGARDSNSFNGVAYIVVSSCPLTFKLFVFSLALSLVLCVYRITFVVKWKWQWKKKNTHKQWKKNNWRKWIRIIWVRLKF